MAWGISPQAMLGHSVGEYVAAWLASSLSKTRWLWLPCVRLMQQLPTGSMLAVSARGLRLNLVDEKIILAASNGPKRIWFQGHMTP